MKKVSVKYKKNLAIYSILKKDFLIDNPVCKAGHLIQAVFPNHGCSYYSTDVHHKKGRGVLLTEVKYFLSCCRNCHSWIEQHPKLAQELGLSLSRLTK